MERWKDLVSNNNPQVLEGFTFLEFMGKLSRETERIQKEIEQANKQTEKLRKR